MSVNSPTRYPGDRVYVLRLDRNAVPAERRIFGRLEHVRSGQQFKFDSAEELISCMARAANKEATKED